jgi:hypothetical protein
VTPKQDHWAQKKFGFIDTNTFLEFLLFRLTSTAEIYLDFNKLPIIPKFGIDRQHVFIEQEPDTPWHLQATVRLSATIWNRNT